MSLTDLDKIGALPEAQSVTLRNFHQPFIRPLCLCDFFLFQRITGKGKSRLSRTALELIHAQEPMQATDFSESYYMRRFI